MNKYEILYILASGLEETAYAAAADKYKELVEKSGGTVENVDKWGVKKFAFPIGYKNEGYYVLMTFTAKPDLPLEMERQMRLSDEVVRHLIVRK